MASRPHGGRDLTQGPIAKTLLAFALPTLVSSILQSLNGTINAIWVGRFLGENALAATSNANMIMFLLMSFVFGFGMAATVLIGQAFGRQGRRRRAPGDRHGDRHFCSSSSIAIAALGWYLRAGSPEAAGDARRRSPARARLSARHLPRHAGDPADRTADDGAARRGRRDDAACFMIVAVVLDSGLNPVFILGLGPAPQLGIAGSATATLIANYGQLFGADRLHLRSRPAAAAARAASSATCFRNGAILEDDHRQGPADGPADDRHLLLGAGADRPRQPRGRRHHRRLRRRDAAVDLCADAGDGARRRGQRDGRAEHRRRPVGPGQRRSRARRSSSRC